MLVLHQSLLLRLNLQFSVSSCALLSNIAQHMKGKVSSWLFVDYQQTIRLTMYHVNMIDNASKVTESSFRVSVIKGETIYVDCVCLHCKDRCAAGIVCRCCTVCRCRHLTLPSEHIWGPTTVCSVINDVNII